MSFPRYPTYKQSGVDWLGDVPAHWDVQRLKALFELQNRVPLEGDGIVTAFRDGEVTLRSNRRTEGFTNAVQEAGYQRVLKGDLVVHAMDAFAGAIGVSDSDGKSTPVYSVCTPRHPAVHVPYFGRLLRHIALSGYITALAKGIRERSTEFRWNEASNVRVAVPGHREQQAIAAFLDRETAKIDALVAEQERLIELLKEKRQAVIAHAVTKGLNPDAPMKESGIEGLGSVPQHWNVTKMKWVARMESGHTPDKKVAAYWDGGEIPWVSLNDTGYLKDHDFITDTAFQVTEAGIANSSAHLLPARAVVFSRDATIGRCAITTRPMAVSQHFIAWLCGPRLLPEFLLLRLRSMTQELDRLTTGATIKTIGMPEVRTIATTVPPLDEQKAIVAQVTEQSATFDALIAEAERAAVLLQERRAALISAAVTGQIDVRPESMRTAA